MPENAVVLVEASNSHKAPFLMRLGGPHVVVVKYGSEGKLLKILENNQAKVVKLVSQIKE